MYFVFLVVTNTINDETAKKITEIMNFTTSVGKFSCLNKSVQIHSERKNPKKVKATGKIKQKI